MINVISHLDVSLNCQMYLPQRETRFEEGEQNRKQTRSLRQEGKHARLLPNSTQVNRTTQVRA